MSVFLKKAFIVGLKKRKMPAHKVGRQWKFKAAEVDSWILAGNASEVKLNSEIQNEI
jgi:hypothetical protein